MESFFQSEMQAHYKQLLSYLPVEIAQDFSRDSATATIRIIGALELMQKLLVKKTYARSLRAMWIFYASIAVLGLVSSIFISQQNLSTEHFETRIGLEKGGVSPVNEGL